MAKGKYSSLSVEILPQCENIIRVVYSYEKEKNRKSSLISEDFEPQNNIGGKKYIFEDNCISFLNRHGEIILKETARSLTEKMVYRYIIDGEPVIKRKQTANGIVEYIENAHEEPAGTSYEGKLVFSISGDEALYGLGQHEDGIYNYHQKTEYLYQNNMKIAIPFILSSRNYGIMMMNLIHICRCRRRLRCRTRWSPYH